MTAARQRVIYLHGFNSSPASKKARLFTDYCRNSGIHDVVAPALSHDPARALQTIYECIGGDEGFAGNAGVCGKDAGVALLVGSSLGGYYATYLAERHGFKAALINPAVGPCDNMRADFIGRHRNYYTQEEYEFTAEHVAFLRTLSVERIRDPALYLLLVQTADEVLDYRLAVKLYAGCRQVVQEGGSHSFDDFAAVLPLILQFANLQHQ